MNIVFAAEVITCQVVVISDFETQNIILLRGGVNQKVLILGIPRKLKLKIITRVQTQRQPELESVE